MQRISILIIFLVLSHFYSAQCQFMTERDFEAAKYRMSANRGNINAFQTAMDLSRRYCLTSTQARELANYLANDRDKFDFLKSSYINISDKENFADVMDVFRLFSSAIRLYHFTMAAPNAAPPIPTPTTPNCNRAMDPQSFSYLRNTVMSAQEDRQKASQILNAANNCLNTQQVNQLVTLIRDENIQFDILKRLYPVVFDPQNYHQAALYLPINVRSQFVAFLENQNGSPNPTSVTLAGSATPIAVSELDFNQFLASIKKLSFEKDKDNYIKTYMKNAYMNTAQIRQVLKLLTFDATKLDVAKFLFDRCIDKQNYFSVADDLQFSSSKEDLNQYVKSRM